ncbi:unnamed protein product [Prunus armeniaca]
MVSHVALDFPACEALPIRGVGFSGIWEEYVIIRSHTWHWNIPACETLPIRGIGFFGIWEEYLTISSSHVALDYPACDKRSVYLGIVILLRVALDLLVCSKITGR